MGYGVHIEREGAPIPLAEWLHAVAATEGVRPIGDGLHRVANPVTGESIVATANPGDAEIVADGEAFRVLRFAEGRATAQAKAAFDDPTDPLRIAMRALAHTLDARIMGDEGEVDD